MSFLLNFQQCLGRNLERVEAYGISKSLEDTILPLDVRPFGKIQNQLTLMDPNLYTRGEEKRKIIHEKKNLEMCLSIYQKNATHDNPVEVW